MATGVAERGPDTSRMDVGRKSRRRIPTGYLLLLPGALWLAMFFVMLNLVVDVFQTALDPRIQRS